ncbi:MAG: hypothetical protein ACRELV_06490, partial [Longimicrobiales bacterium]
LRLREAARDIRGSEFGEPALVEEAEDLELLAERFEAEAVGEIDRKYLHMRAYAAERSWSAPADVIARTKRPRRTKRARGTERASRDGAPEPRKPDPGA